MSEELQGAIALIMGVACASVATILWISDNPIWLALLWTVNTLLFCMVAWVVLQTAGVKWVRRLWDE